MKKLNLILIITITSTIVFAYCSTSSQTTNHPIKSSLNLGFKGCFTISDNLKLNIGDTTSLIISSCDSVLVKKIRPEYEVDSISGSKYSYNVADSIGYLDRYCIDILQFFLLSDSTYNWTGIKTKHEFEPYLMFDFFMDSLKTSVIYSPTSREFGFGYKSYFTQKEFITNSSMEDYFQRIESLFQLDTIQTDTIVPNIIQDSIIKINDSTNQ